MAEPFIFADIATDLLVTAAQCLEDHTEAGAPAEVFLSHDGTPRFCCFAGDTEVVTRAGTRRIADLAADESAVVMTTGGEWVEAPVLRFGVQNTQEIVVERNRRRKTIRATPAHRWITARGDVLTRDLMAGDMLATETGVAVDVDPDREWVARGIVYGDGSMGWADRSTVADLYDAKVDDLAKWMPDYARAGDETTANGGNRRQRFYGLPAEWKDLPDLAEASDAQLLGWMAGYFATDGSVDRDRNLYRIGSVREEAVRTVRDVCYRLGIMTSPIQHQRITGGSFKEGGHDYFWVSLTRATIPPSMLIRRRHRTDSGPAKRPRRWRVVEVREPDRREEVFCAVVPDTHAFVLADNILTGNCNYLSVHASLIYGTERFPAPQTTATRRCAELGQAMQLTLRLRRCDYPRLRPQREAPFPPADEITAASRDLLVDARVLWCCVVGAYDQGELFQNPNLDYLPAHERENTLLPTIFGQMTPVREASCAGWDWTITVEMAPCCGLPSIASGS